MTLAGFYHYFSYRYNGVSNTGIPARNFPVPVFVAFPSNFTKFEFHEMFDLFGIFLQNILTSDNDVFSNLLGILRKSGKNK